MGCKAQVHVVEVPCEQVRLFAPLRSTDLHNDRSTVVWILGQQEGLERILDGRDRLHSPIDLTAHLLALFRFRTLVELRGDLDVLACRAQPPIRCDDLRELLVTPRQVAKQGRICRGGRLHQPRFDSGELLFDGVETLVHVRSRALLRSGRPNQDLGVLAVLRTP